MTTPATHSPLDIAIVTCSRCGETAPAGTRQCPGAKCHALLPGNPGREAQVPGASALQRRGPEALSEANAKVYEDFTTAVIADLGGYRNLSMAKVGLVEMLGQEYIVAGMIAEHLHEHGALTP